MVGVIRLRDVFQNLRLIRREFGLACLLRCVRASTLGPRTTFLQIIWESRK